jgi:tetratricopeptide (TPR) repeat protein
VQKDGLTLLLRARRFDEAADLSLRGELTDPTDPGRLATLQRFRTLALLQGGHPAQALEAAKGLFNVTPMENTDRALLLLAQALAAAHPDQADLVERFRAEQKAGASTRPVDNPTTRPGVIMASIHVDDAPYAVAIANNDPDRYVINSHEYKDLVNRGNLLLLADRSEEALANYQRMARLAVDDRQKAQANEGIARALKAQASAIGPANRWIFEIGGGR